MHNCADDVGGGARSQRSTRLRLAAELPMSSAPLQAEPYNDQFHSRDFADCAGCGQAKANLTPAHSKGRGKAA